MPSPLEARSVLAAQQAALMCGDCAPPQFERERFDAAGRALRRKRMRAVARTMPALMGALGERVARFFDEFAAETPLPQTGGALADGRRFAAWLAGRGKLPAECRLPLFAFDLRYATGRDGLTARRCPAFRAALLDSPRRLVVSVHLPWLGNYVANIRLGH